MSLIREICKILRCQPSAIGGLLTKCGPRRRKVISFLAHRTLRTTYLDRNGFTKSFHFGGLTHDGAHEIMAYGALFWHYNCSISSFFFTRHNIKLKYPTAQCIIEFRSRPEHYFPLELLELVPDHSPRNELAPREPSLGRMRVNRWLAVDEHQQQENCKGEDLLLENGANRDESVVAGQFANENEGPVAWNECWESNIMALMSNSCRIDQKEASTSQAEDVDE